MSLPEMTRANVGARDGPVRQLYDATFVALHSKFKNYNFKIQHFLQLIYNKK